MTARSNNRHDFVFLGNVKCQSSRFSFARSLDGTERGSLRFSSDRAVRFDVGINKCLFFQKSVRVACSPQVIICIEKGTARKAKSGHRHAELALPYRHRAADLCSF